MLLFCGQNQFDTHDASITQGLRPNLDEIPNCMVDNRLADEKTARRRAKWLRRLPGDWATLKIEKKSNYSKSNKK